MNQPTTHSTNQQTERFCSVLLERKAMKFTHAFQYSKAVSANGTAK
jgi:hypothetical protein